MATEFWGVEVKRGESLKVTPGYGMILHLSQASLGEHKNEKGKESVSLLINIDGNKLVLGTLITNKLPQHQFDLLFDREFELSHDWKGGSVYFYGYKASNSLGEDESPEGEFDESESEYEFEDDEDMPLNLADNGKPKSNAEQVKSELKAKQEKSESNAELEKPEGKAKLQKPDFKADQQKPESKPEQEKTNTMAAKRRRRRRRIRESKVNQDKPAEAEGCNATCKETDVGKDSVKVVETPKEGKSDESELKDDEDPLYVADNGKPMSNAEQVKPELKAKQEKSESNAELENPEGKVKLEKPEFKAEQQKPESETEQEKTDSKAKRKRRRKHDSKVNQDKPAETEGCNAPCKETDVGKDSVKIAETRKDVNPQEDDESTFEDLMSDDDEEDESQVSSHKKRNKRKKAKRLVPHENDGDKAAPLPGNEAVQTPIDQANKPKQKPARTISCNICNKWFISAHDLESHTKAKHGDGK